MASESDISRLWRPIEQEAPTRRHREFLLLQVRLVDLLHVQHVVLKILVNVIHQLDALLLGQGGERMLLLLVELRQAGLRVGWFAVIGVLLRRYVHLSFVLADDLVDASVLG